MKNIKQKRICRVCGCSDESACFNEDMGFCWWVEDDLCSHCDPETIQLQKSLDKGESEEEFLRSLKKVS